MVLDVWSAQQIASQLALLRRCWAGNCFLVTYQEMFFFIYYFYCYYCFPLGLKSENSCKIGIHTSLSPYNVGSYHNVKYKKMHNELKINPLSIFIKLHLLCLTMQSTVPSQRRLSGSEEFHTVSVLSHIRTVSMSPAESHHSHCWSLSHFVMADWN